MEESLLLKTTLPARLLSRGTTRPSRALSTVREKPAQAPPSLGGGPRGPTEQRLPTEPRCGSGARPPRSVPQGRATPVPSVACPH